jgi:phytoene dehydrogenase-like protein
VDITVVGSGPNGLSAAVICARAGLSVQVLEAQPTLGGGARTLPDPEFPGVGHDICSAIHPLALASPFFAAFDLRSHGVELAVPEISYASPFADRPAVLAYRDVDRTCAGLEDGASWRRLLGPLAEHSDSVVALLLGDKRSVPADLPMGVRLAVRMLTQATPAWGTLRGEDAQALFTGVAAHTISRMPSLVAAAAGLMLATLGHSVGWPVPIGGSQSITDTLVTDLRAHGGVVHSNAAVTSPPEGIVIYDTAPTALLDIYRDRLPAKYAKALRNYTFGPGVAKVDFVLTEDIPWTDARLKEVATFHLGGTRAQMAQAEREIAAGRHAERPMALAATPYTADSSRIDSQGRRPFWTYVHVPAGSTVDQAQTVTEIMESLAPGFTDIVAGVRSIPANLLAAHNANYVGGDIGVGGTSVIRALAGPTPRVNPWATPIPRAYLCSAATPPGAGVHGMGGYFAARTVLQREFGLPLPSLEPKTSVR